MKGTEGIITVGATVKGIKQVRYSTNLVAAPSRANKTNERN